MNSVASAGELPAPLERLSATKLDDRWATLGGVRISLAQPRATAAARGVPVLAIWALDDDLERVEALKPSALCVIPFGPAATLRWAQTWSPADLLAGTDPGPAPTIRNRVVLAAMVGLTHSVNLSTGIAQSSDRSAAIHTFKALYAAGERFDGDEIQVWAAANNWRAQDARKLGELAQKVAAGRQVRAPGMGALQVDIVDVWRAEATRL